MTTRSTFRWFVCLGILSLTLLTGAAGGASASTLIPMADTGGPGGSGGAGMLDESDRALALIALSVTPATAGTLDETDRALALIEAGDAADTAVLVGSGPERETVAQSDGTVAADPDFAPTANERSIQLTESLNAPGGILAGIPAPPARVAYEDSEHAVAQNRFADEVAVVEINRGQAH